MTTHVEPEQFMPVAEWPDPVGDPMLVENPRKLWDYAELSEAMEGEWLAAPDTGQAITGVTYQYKRIRSGDLVFQQNKAQWGGTFKSRDARAYFKKGASALVTADERHLPEPGLNIFRVKNTRTAIMQLGLYARDRLRGCVVGITGTAGKSTTKEMLRCMLAHERPTVASRGNFNHSVGIAASLAQTPPAIDYAIYELGVGNPKRTPKRAQMIRPNIALITDIFYDHLTYYDTIEDYADQKCVIYDTLQPDGIAILNRDSAFYDRLHANVLRRGISRLFTYGEHPEANLKLLSYQLGESGSRARVADDSRTAEFEVDVPGRHMVINAVAALSLVSALGLDWTNFAPYLKAYKPIFQRTERFTIAMNARESFTFIDDCFNANSGSMQAGLDMLTLQLIEPPAKKIIILGDMLGLGKFSKEQHEALHPFVEKQTNSRVFLFGEEMRHLYAQIPRALRHISHTDSLAEVEQNIFASISNGDLLYFKASDPTDAYMPFIARLKSYLRN